jgi:GLPGLI family protein
MNVVGKLKQGLGATGKAILLLAAITLCDQTFGQKYQVVYAQFDQIDTARYESTPFTPNPDTLSKWIFLYDNGLALMKQTEDSPYERKLYLRNKKTLKLDDVTTINMSRYDVYYHDYKKKTTFRINHFFDVKYVIEDVMPYFEWTFYEEARTIVGHPCKRATARYPLDKHLMFNVWYAVDIPIDGGPMDLNGLPGLVLQVDRNREPFYKAISITPLSENKPVAITKPVTDQKPMTLSEYQKLRFGVPFENYNKQPPNKEKKDN